MAAPSGSSVEDVLNRVSAQTKRLDSFLSIQNEVADELRSSTKLLYDFSKSIETCKTGSESLPELIIDNFDDEQVWQELELHNDPAVSDLLSCVAKSLASKSNLSFAIHKNEETSNKCSTGKAPYQNTIKKSFPIDEELSSEENDEDIELDQFQSQSHSDDSDDSDADLKHVLEKAGANVYSRDDSESEGDVMEYEHEEDDEQEGGQEDTDSDPEITFRTQPKLKKKLQHNDIGKAKRISKSVVDDKFFKLSEMEVFLEQEDAREERKRRQESGQGDQQEEEEEKEDDIDLFENIESDAEASEGDIMYADFFDQPSSQVSNKQNISIEEEDQMEEEEEDVGSGDLHQDEKNVEGTDEEKEIQTRVQSGRDLFAASDSEGEDIGDIFGGKKIHEKSSFEKRQEKLKERISELEETALAQKPWQLTGETIATARPENSLLQEDLEFEHTTRLAPVITEETTASLESVIKQRIKDQAFDDVERKIKPTEDAFQYKKRITLDQEKSKQSLGEIYEQEYLQQKQETEEDKTDPQHEDIKKMMQSLFIKLDALSNFHYTPKPAVPEVKIVSNMPSIVMEEVAPLSASSATLLAPEEIQEKPKGDIKGKSEATDTDRKHERRLKKKVKRLKEKEKKKRQKLVEKLKPGLSNKHSKKKALKELEKQEKTSKNLTVIKEDKSRKAGLTSSKAFFTQLQEEAKTQIRIHKTTKNEKIKAKANTAAKLKL